MMTCKVDTSLFSEMLRELQRTIPGQDEITILKSEVGAVLTKCVDLTAAAQVKKITQRSERSRFTTQPASIYTPTTGEARKNRGGKTNLVYFLDNKYPNRLWKAIERRRKLDLAKILKARGLAKQSWYLIAVKLGIPIKVPEFVRKAVATTGKTYTGDVNIKEQYDATKIEISIENLQPTANAIGGSYILQRAIDGRVQFYLTNLRHGVFKSIAKIARKYPGIKVTP